MDDYLVNDYWTFPLTVINVCVCNLYLLFNYDYRFRFVVVLFLCIFVVLTTRTCDRKKFLILNFSMNHHIHTMTGVWLSV